MNIYIEIPLPFEIPIEEGLKLVSGYPEVKFYTEFVSYERSTIIYNDFSEVQNCTLLKIKYFPEYPHVNSLNEDELLRLTVLDSIWYINKLIDATRNSFGLDYLYNLTIWDLPSHLIVNLNEENYLYLTKPQELLRERFSINSEGLNLIGATIGKSDNYPEFFLADKFFDSAKSCLYKEQFIDSIIFLQTSFEVFIRSLMLIILKKKGVSEEKILQANKISFRNTIEDHLGKHLNCNLNFITSKKINFWYKNLYLLRNDIVHGGKINLTGDEAYLAYDSYVETRKFLAEKMVEKGYLDSDKNLDLTLFKKNTPDSIDRNKFINHLITLGLVSSDTKMI